MTQTQVCAHVVISGKVQGVFFRAETHKMALKIGISGWVRNQPDGSVEAMFYGARQNVEAAIHWCRQGSPASVVSNVEIEWVECDRNYPEFSIRY